MGLHIRIDLSNPFNHRDVAVFHCTQYSPLLLEIGVIDAWIWCPTFRVWNNQFDWGRGFSLNRPKEIPRALGDTDWSFASREQTSTIHLARQGAFTLTTWPCMWSPGAVAKQHNSITFSRLCMSIAFLLPSTKSVDRVGLFGWVCVSLQGPQHSDQRRVFDATLQRPFNWVAVNASFLLKIVQCIRKGLSSGSCYRIPDVSNAYFVIKERSNTPFRNWPGRDLEPKIRSAPNHILWGVKKKYLKPPPSKYIAQSHDIISNQLSGICASPGNWQHLRRGWRLPWLCSPRGAGNICGFFVVVWQG